MAKKINIQTKSIWNSILFEYKKENNTIRDTLIEAVKNGANLRGANLRGANLRGANLRGAKNLKLYWHIHHSVLFENLTEPLKNRIDYIKKEKSKEEIKLRLKLLKKIKCKPENYPADIKGW